MAEEKDVKISFISKKEYECPVCDEVFRKEELLSGGGRLIAGALTEELHRLFEPSAKYGSIFPLAYSLAVCPRCWFASFDADYPLFPAAKKGEAFAARGRRKKETLLAFPSADFSGPRGLMEGAASYYLAMRCYDYYGKDVSPTIKRGLSALRGAWLIDELHLMHPGQNYDWLAVLFRKKAQYFYVQALEKEQRAAETMSAVKNFGPDIDKNYAYKGMLYLTAYLSYKFGPPAGDTEERKATLEVAGRTIAKVFGMGKASKDLPEALLDLARRVYGAIKEELEELKARETA